MNVARRASAVTFRPLMPTIGAEVIGVDLSRPVDDATFAAIKAAWLEHGVLVFRGQTAMTVDDQIAFSRRFGRLNMEMVVEKLMEGRPEIFVLSNVIKDGKPAGVADGGQFWHSDLYYMPQPAAGSFLHGIVVPPVGGETKFAAMYAAYEALPEAMKRKIDPLTNRVTRVKSYPINYPMKPPLTEQQKKTFQDCFHPVVRRHPETGRKCLFIGDISAGTIEGLPEAEGDALLRELHDFATRPEFVYVHTWQAGDAVLWDNRCTLHSATPFDKMKYERLMQRTTIMDDILPAR